MSTQAAIREFFLSNPSPDEIRAAQAAHPEVTTEQIATAMQVGTDDVKRVLGGQSDGALPPAASQPQQGQNAVTSQQIKQFFATNPTPQAAAAAVRAHNISADQIARAMQVGVADVNRYFTNAGITDIYGANATPMPRQTYTEDGTGSNQSMPTPVSLEQQLANFGYTQTEDGRYRSADGESFIDRDQAQQMFPDSATQMRASGYLPIGATGLTQETVDWLNNKYGSHFADPAAYYNYVYGPGGKVTKDADGNDYYALPAGKTEDQFVNKPLTYTAPKNFGDYLPMVWAGLATMGIGTALTGALGSIGANAIGGAIGGFGSAGVTGGDLTKGALLGAAGGAVKGALFPGGGENLTGVEDFGDYSNWTGNTGLEDAPWGVNPDTRGVGAEDFGDYTNWNGNTTLGGDNTITGIEDFGDYTNYYGDKFDPSMLNTTEFMDYFKDTPTSSLVSKLTTLGIPAAAALTIGQAVSGGMSLSDALSVAKTTGALTNTGGGLVTSITKLFDGKADASDLLKLGLTAAGAAALLGDNPDRTTTTKVEYPDWYNKGSQSALTLADQYAALGPNSVAPLSSNEVAANTMASTYAGKWLPTLEKANATIDSAGQSFDKAGALADSVPGYLDRATGQVDAAMPYFDKAGTMADTVGGYLDRSSTLTNEAAGGIPSVDLSAYMNPYLDNVLTPIARRNELAKAAALNDIKAKAGMRGAFGGSRSTLLETETAGNADRNLNEAEANIRSGAFTTGLNTAQADLNRKLQAGTQFGALGTTAGNTANTYNTIGKSVADTAGQFNNMGVVATGAANANTNVGKSLTDAAGGYRANAGTYGALTSTDIGNLQSTGATTRGVDQAKLNAPLTAIGGYANALRGNPGSTTTAVAPEASKLGQATGALTALLGANKAGWI